MFATHTGVMFRDRNHIDVPGFFFPKKKKINKKSFVQLGIGVTSTDSLAFLSIKFRIKETNWSSVF